MGGRDIAKTLEQAHHIADLARKVVIFLLGCFLIVDYVVSRTSPTIELIAGGILIGILPIDGVIDFIGRHWRP